MTLEDKVAQVALVDDKRKELIEFLDTLGLQCERFYQANVRLSEAFMWLKESIYSQ